MVCGNMDVEVVPGSYMDDLYDSAEEKVTTLRTFLTIGLTAILVRLPQLF